MCVCRGAGRLMNHGCWFGCNDAAAEMSLTEMETPRPYLHQLHESLNVHRFVSELLYESFLWLGWNMNSDQRFQWRKNMMICVNWAALVTAIASVYFCCYRCWAIWIHFCLELIMNITDGLEWFFQNLLCVFASEQFNVLLFSLGCKQQNSSSVMFEEHAAVIKARETSSS